MFFMAFHCFEFSYFLCCLFFVCLLVRLFVYSIDWLVCDFVGSIHKYVFAVEKNLAFVSLIVHCCNLIHGLLNVIG